MKKIALLVFMYFAGSWIVFCQSISMEFPAFAGKTYDFIIFQGSKPLTIVQDTIPSTGKFTLEIPPAYSPYTGMSRWLITGTKEGGGLDMAIPGHNFSVRCLSSKPSNDNIMYTGFDPVNELNDLNAKQSLILDKFATMRTALQLYDAKHKLYKRFKKEQEAQIKAYAEFQQSLKQNPSFNARFLPIVNLTKGIAPKLSNNYTQIGPMINGFISDELSFDDLYVSGHWTGIIRNWVELQLNIINDQDAFKRDFEAISNRIESPKMYTDFVGKVTYYLTTFGNDSYIDAISKYVLESGKITEYLGSLQVYLKSRTGTKAPDLIIKRPITAIETIKTDALDSKYTLLLFYKSDCGPCADVLEGLTSDYSRAKEKGVRIISISMDTEEKIYKNTAALIPWPDIYCDFEGSQGINFKNYAVSATPTMFLLDSTGIILEKFSTLEQFTQWSKEPE